MTRESNDINQYLLSDLIDIQAFQNLTESFSRLTGIATAILDLEGNVLVSSGWQKICTEFHRKHPTTARRCLESDTILANQLNQGGKYNVYKCKNGLIDVAVPLLIDEMHVGNMFTGQFFFEPPDLELFAHQAEEFGFSKNEYLDLLKDIPVLPAERVEQAVAFLSNLTAIISKSGLDKKKLLDFSLELERQVEQRTKEILSERTYSESLIKSLPGIMYVFDKLGCFKKWNHNLEVVSGYSANEIKDLNPLDMFTSVTDKQRIMQAIDKVFREGSATIEADLSLKDGKQIPYMFTGYKFTLDDTPYLVGVGLDISERIKTEKEKEVLIGKLQVMLSQVKQLSGFLPICASCKNIRDDEGYWNQIETYIREHSEVQFSHSICPDCAKKLYPELNIFQDKD